MSHRESQKQDRGKTQQPILSRRTFLKGLGLVGGLFVLQGSLPFRALAHHPPLVKIGGFFPLTGGLAELGYFLRQAAESAVSQINEASQAVLGGPILELVLVDTQSSVEGAVNAAQSLIFSVGVPAIVGPVTSGATVVVATAVAIPSETVLISPTASAPEISTLADDDFIFRTTGPLTLEGIVAALLTSGQIFPDYQFNSASVLFENTVYGNSLANAFVEAYQNLGGAVVATVPYPPDTIGFIPDLVIPLLVSAVSANPGMLLVISRTFSDTFQIISQAVQQLGITNLQFTGHAKSSLLVEALDPELLEALEGKLGTAPGSPEWPGFDQFAAEFGEPLPFEGSMAATYDAVVAIGLSVTQAIADGYLYAEDISGAVIRDRLRPACNPPGEVTGVGLAEIKHALRNIAVYGVDNDYSGATGPVDFDEFGDAPIPIGIWTFAGGTIQTVATIPPDEIPPLA